MFDCTYDAPVMVWNSERVCAFARGCSIGEVVTGLGLNAIAYHEAFSLG